MTSSSTHILVWETRRLFMIIQDFSRDLTEKEFMLWYHRISICLRRFKSVKRYNTNSTHGIQSVPFIIQEFKLLITRWTFRGKFCELVMSFHEFPWIEYVEMFIRVYLINNSSEFCKLPRSSQFNLSLPIMNSLRVLPEFAWENKLKWISGKIGLRQQQRISRCTLPLALALSNLALVWFLHPFAVSLSLSTPLIAGSLSLSPELSMPIKFQVQ